MGATKQDEIRNLTFLATDLLLDAKLYDRFHLEF
jgi:hypothetical protein